MSKAKSIFAKLKASQAFEPQICPIIINGDNGAEGKHAFANLIVYSSTCIIRQGNFNKKQESSACHAVTQTYSSNLVIINRVLLGIKWCVRAVLKLDQHHTGCVCDTSTDTFWDVVS